MDDFFKNIHQRPQKSDNFFDSIASQKNEEELSRRRKQEIERLKKLLSTRLAEGDRLQNMNLFGNKNKKELQQIENIIAYIIQEETKSDNILRNFEKIKLIQDMLKEITSLGKIHHLMEDASISEVMINAYDEVWIESGGKLQRTDVIFDDEDEVLNLARKIASHVGRRIDNSSPTVDARLPDGSRVHVITPPLAMKGTTITIRKFKEDKLGIEDLIKFGSITRVAATFMVNAVKARCNTIVSGGTGSGKTTTLNILSNSVPNDERVITIEDSAELQLANDHVVKLEARPANSEGKGEYTIRMLIKDALRMRPERVIVGEVRDGSAFDLMQACNTGHDGSMGTVHANNPDACVSRLDNLIMQAGFKMENKAIRELIAQSVDLVVQIQRMKDGSRKITHISHVSHYDEVAGKVVVHNIFEYRLSGIVNGKVQGEMAYTGYVPSEDLLDKFERYGLDFHSLVNSEEEVV